MRQILNDKQEEVLKSEIFKYVQSEITSDPFEAGDITDSITELVRQVLNEGGL